MQKLPIEKSKGLWKKGKKIKRFEPVTATYDETESQSDVKYWYETHQISKKEYDQYLKRQEEKYKKEKIKDTKTKGNPYYKEKMN